MTYAKTSIALLLFLAFPAFLAGLAKADEPEETNKVYLPIISKPPLSDYSTFPLPLKGQSTIESIGISAPFTKDINDNNFAIAYYRPVGSDAWLEAQAMSRDGSSREWRTSLVYLSPNTKYEVKVKYQDSDGVSADVVTGTVRTRPEYPSLQANNRVITVPAGGTLQEVLNQAKPGDTIQLLSGIYHESISLEASHSGKPGQYITIEPAPGASVIFDGSDVNLNSPADDWLLYTKTAQGDIYYTDLPWGNTDCHHPEPGYIGELVGQKEIQYQLFTSEGNNWQEYFLPAPAGKAFYVCNNSEPGPKRRLYVVTYSGDDPDNHTMYVSRQTQAILLKAADYVRIRGLEFRYYSRSGVELHTDSAGEADYNIVENNVFHGIGEVHVRIRGEANHIGNSANLVQNNLFYETGYRNSGWQWSIYYSHGHNAVTGVQLDYAGPGNIIRGNRFNSGHDGIVVKRQTSNVDIYDNIIDECMDDGIELDNTPGQNIRLWRNTINYCYTAISLQDWNSVGLGPVYIFRNVLVGGDDPQGRTDYQGNAPGYATYTAFKVGSDINSKSAIFIYHNTVSIIRSSQAGNGIQDSGGLYFANAVTRNNIWHISRRAFNLNSSTAIINHDFDCDNLHNLDPANKDFIKWSSKGGPNGDGTYRNLAEFQAYTHQEPRGISDARTLFDAEMSLKPGSPDIDAGCLITGFNDRGPHAYVGIAPDIGAFEYRP